MLSVMVQLVSDKLSKGLNTILSFAEYYYARGRGFNLRFNFIVRVSD